jgi:hypothetical protein
MEADRGSKPVMGMSLGLAVARRALLLALVALLVAVVALVAAFVADSGSDDAADVVDSDDLAEARTAAAAAQASAEDAAIMSAASAAKADEAAVVAQEAVVMAQQAAAAAEAAAAQAAAAVESLAAAQAAAGAEGDTQPAEAPDPAEAETTDATGTDTAGTAEETEEAAEPAAETDAADTDSSTDTQDADTSDTGGDQSGEASTGGADGAPEPAVSLPGEPYEFGPPEGAALAVVGVSHDSVLNVRDVPAGEIVARLDNVMNVGSEPVVYVREADSDGLIATLDLNRGVIATGSTRRLPTTIWHEIRMADAVGWASSAFLSPLGATSDATAEIVAILGEAPAAPTLAELARVVAGAVASDDPPSRIVLSGAPVVGDLAEITVDVLGLPDDAVRGFRLQVFAQQDSDAGSFVLKSVESTTICDSYRGVSEEGLCN